MRNERPLAALPKAVLIALPLALAAQIAWQAALPAPQARAEDLPPAPPVEHLRLLAFGEPVTAARLLMLWLQSFDNQPGVSVPFRALDYGRLGEWLERILALDRRSQYPLLAAARLYGEVPVPEKQRVMTEFVYRAFLEDPARRWPWLAHAVYISKHRIGDLELALRYARALAEHTAPGEAPAWARQMHIFVIEDMGEIAAAKVLLGGLLESGEITDPNELRFLKWRLAELERAGAR